MLRSLGLSSPMVGASLTMYGEMPFTRWASGQLPWRTGRTLVLMSLFPYPSHAAMDSTSSLDVSMPVVSVSEHDNLLKPGTPSPSHISESSSECRDMPSLQSTAIAQSAGPV